MHPRRFGPRGLTACRRSSAEIPTSRNILYANSNHVPCCRVLDTLKATVTLLARGLRPLSGTNSLATMRRNHMMLRTMPLASGGGGRKQRRQLLTCKVRLPTATTWTQPLQPCCCPSPDRAQPGLLDAPRLPGVDFGARAFPCVAVATPALALALRPCAMPVWKGAGRSWRSPLCMSAIWCLASTGRPT